MTQPTNTQLIKTFFIMLGRFILMVSILTLVSTLMNGCYTFQSLTQVPVDFGQPTYIYDLSKANVSNGESYAEHTVTLEENVSYKDSCVYLETKPYNKMYHFWDKDRFCNHSTGWIDFKNVESPAYGIYEAVITLDGKTGTWPAMWALHKRHYAPETAIKVKVDSIKTNTIYVPYPNPIKINWVIMNNSDFLGYVIGLDSISVTLDRTINVNLSEINASIDNIIPEIDVMEVLSNGKIRHTVHHGYDRTEYALYHDGKYICYPIAGHKYKFAVKITPEGYTFYIDRIKTYELKNPNSTCDEPLLWIINNAILPEFTEEINSVMKIYSFKYYKPCVN